MNVNSDCFFQSELETFLIFINNRHLNLYKKVPKVLSNFWDFSYLYILTYFTGKCILHLFKPTLKQSLYLFFLQSLLMSSKVLPFVSGTQRHTKIAAATQIIP